MCRAQLRHLELDAQKIRLGDASRTAPTVEVDTHEIRIEDASCKASMGQSRRNSGE